MLGPYAGPWKNHSSAGTDLKKGSMWFANSGDNTKRAHRPTTMLGTAARRSIAVARGPASHRGASSERNAAVPRPIGMTITMATAVVTIVPTTRMPAPNWLAAGFQVPDHKKAIPECANAWLESMAILTTRPTSTATKSPAAAQRASP